MIKEGSYRYIILKWAIRSSFLLVVFLTNNIESSSQVIDTLEPTLIDTTTRHAIIQDSTLIDKDHKTDSLSIAVGIDTTGIKLDSIISKKKWPKILRAWHTNIDSNSINYMYADGSKLHPFTDTTLNADILEEDLAKVYPNNNFHIGNIGSATTPYRYTLSDNINKDIGLHQYDLYNSNIDSFKTYIVHRPYSQAYFHTGANKNNFSTGIKFANQYANDIHLNIDFKRINYEGLYSNQNTKHSDFKGGLFWNKNRYQLYILFQNRTNLETNNGGILVGQNLDTLINRLRKNVNTKLINANTRHYLSGLDITNRYTLLGKDQNNIEVYHNISYNHYTYKYSDIDIYNDSTYYKQLLRDTRGIRFYLNQNVWSNRIGAKLSNKKYFTIDAALRHQNHHITNDFINERTNPVDLFIDASFKILRWQNNGKLVINILGQENNSNLNLSSVLNFGKKLGKLKIAYQNLRKSASFIQNRLILNNEELWENDFNIQFSNSFSASYDNKYTRTNIEVKSTFLNNHIYMDTSMTFLQHKSTLNIQQLSLKQGFKIGNMYSSHEVLLQKSNEKIFSLPNLYTKHDLYWHYHLKSSNKSIRLGVNFKYYKSEKMLFYQPALGTFAPSNTDFEDYWSSDAYFSMKISTLRFFVKYYNVDQLIDQKVDFQIYNQPQFDSIVLFGVNWILYN